MKLSKTILALLCIIFFKQTFAQGPVNWWLTTGDKTALFARQQTLSSLQVIFAWTSSFIEDKKKFNN